MLKKLLVTGFMLMGGVSSAMAGFYMGPKVTYESISAGDIDYQGFTPSLVFGYSGFLGKTLYLAVEAQGGAFSIPHNNNPNTQGGLKTSYRYGASLIPGMYLDNIVLAYARVGFLKTHFSNLNETPAGFTMGAGLEVAIAEHWQVLGEVGRTQYDYITNIGHPYAYEYTVGITHRFS